MRAVVCRCGPCTLVHKELLKLGAVRPKGSFEVLALDVDASEANSQLATELAVYTLPTLIFVGEANCYSALGGGGDKRH